MNLTLLWFSQQMVDLLHLISLNKYVVTLIINQGNSCLTYFMIVSLFLAVGFSYQIIPLLEKILLLVRYVVIASGLMKKLRLCHISVKKFVVSSIIRCYISRRSATFKVSYRPNSFSLFVLFHT